MLHAGIVLSGTSPPAAPTSFAAISAPHTADKFGATSAMREPTKLCSLARSASRRCASAHASITLRSSAGGSAWPSVVEADTETVIWTWRGMTSSRSMAMTLSSLPIRSTTRAYASGSRTSPSSSGKRFLYLHAEMRNVMC